MSSESGRRRRGLCVGGRGHRLNKYGRVPSALRLHNSCHGLQRQPAPRAPSPPATLRRPAPSPARAPAAAQLPARATARPVRVAAAPRRPAGRAAAAEDHARSARRRASLVPALHAPPNRLTSSARWPAPWTTPSPLLPPTTTGSRPRPLPRHRSSTPA